MALCAATALRCPAFALDVEPPPGRYPHQMYREPYLETCCRSALHRLFLSGSAGRPPDLKDGRCLRRLCGMALSARRADERYELTQLGRARHASEVAPTRRGRAA